MSNELIFKIDSKEIKAALSEAALLMKFAPEAPESAQLTFTSLYRFGKIYDRLKGKEKREETIYKPSSGELKERIVQSGISFFGPMFKDRPIERDSILKSLSEAGYDCSPLNNLTDPQLDMFYSRVLETGLIPPDY